MNVAAAHAPVPPFRRAYEEAMANGHFDGLREIDADEISRALRDGLIVNRVDAEGAPVPIRTDEQYSGAVLDDTPLPTATVTAATLRRGIRAADGDADPRGLRLHRVRVIDEIDWNWLDLPYPVGFEACVLDDISLERTKLRGLDFDTCLFVGFLRSITGTGTSIEAELKFFQCEGLRQLFLPGLQLGEVHLWPENFPNQPLDDVRVVLDGARIETLSINGTEGIDSVLPLGSANAIEVHRLVIAPEPKADDSGRRGTHTRIHEWLAAWIRASSGDGHRPQVWEQFAAALDRGADAGEATELRIEAEKNRSRTRPWWRRTWDAVINATTAHFYKNTRALIWLLAVWAVLTVVTLCAFGDLYAVNSPGAAPPDDVLYRVTWSAVFAANTAILPLDLGFAGLWPGSIALVVIFALLKLVAIVLFALFAAGATGLINRSR